MTSSTLARVWPVDSLDAVFRDEVAVDVVPVLTWIRTIHQRVEALFDVPEPGGVRSIDVWSV